MDLISLREVARHRRRWSEEITLLAPDMVPARASDVLLVSSCGAEISPAAPIGLVHWTPLDSRASVDDVMQNKDATVITIPHLELVGTAPPSTILDAAEFWRIVDNLGPSLPVKMCDLRRRLARRPGDAVAFQHRLIETGSELMAARGASWAQAMTHVLMGRSHFDEVLMGRRPLLDSPLDPCDITDVAEDVVGQHIDIPGYHQSRGDPREGTYFRWLSWRAVAERDGERAEVFYFGARDFGLSIRAMLPLVRSVMARDGFTPISDIESWIPDGLARVPTSFMVLYALARHGGEDREEYLARVGLAPASSLG
jgi:hypothetical protein